MRSRVELFGVAEVFGVDLLVELVGEDLVEVFIGQRREGQLRPPGLFALGLFLALLVVGLLVDVHLLGVHLGGLGLALGVLQLIHRLLLAFLVLALRRFLALAGIGLGLVLVVVLVRLVGVVAQLVGHLEGRDDVAGHARKGGLVVNVVGEMGQLRAGLVLDPVAPQLDHRHGSLRRRCAGQFLAHDERNGVFQRRLLAVGVAGHVLPAVAVIQHCGEIGCHAGHGIGANAPRYGLARPPRRRRAHSCPAAGNAHEPSSE